MADIADIERRLRILEDERAILDTFHRYSTSIDYGDENEWLDCFTETAIWHGIPRREFTGYQGMHWEGHEGPGGLRAFFRQHSHAPGLYHKHLFFSPRIVVEGDTARVDCYYARFDESPDGPYIYTFGRYLDRMVRGSDGRWRFQERITEREAWNPRPSRPGAPLRADAKPTKG